MSSAMEQSQIISRAIGGEAGHRGVLGLGGKRARGRWLAIGLPLVVGLVLTPMLGALALGSGILVAAVMFLLTLQTQRGSIASRWRRRRRWRERVQLGTDTYMPYSEDRWEEATAALHTARGRRAKREARRELAALRVMPDGADGLGWLQCGTGEPGIAWQVPTGEDARLTVAFELPGQLRGLQTAPQINDNAVAFGRFLAGYTLGSLVTQHQIVTRLLPADTALYERWIASHADPGVPKVLLESYAKALDMTSRDAMMQRHYYVATWPLTAEFRAAARRYGDGRNGWRKLMELEVLEVQRDLAIAGFEGTQPLSARKLNAVILHMQNPLRPVDKVDDVSPTTLGLPSRDVWSSHVVSGYDEGSPEPVAWWHRTGRIASEHISVADRTPLWHLDLLLGRQVTTVRTISFHIETVPANIARERTRSDLTNEAADAIARSEQGKLDDGATRVRATAAQRREYDLLPGQHHHGAYWVGYCTISARSRDELAAESRSLESLCAAQLGIDRVGWLDTYQSAASGTTWPLGRGLTPQTNGMADRVMSTLAGKGEKEALS